MSRKRPKLKIPLTGMDVIVEAISATLCLLIIVFTLKYYPELSESIPTHFNGSGKVDAYGHKSSIWILPALCSILCIALAILSRFPHLHNYLVTITEANAFKNYQFSSRILRFTMLFLCLLFGYIQYIIIQNGIGIDQTLKQWLLPFILISTFGLTSIVMIYNYKLNNNDH